MTPHDLRRRGSVRDSGPAALAPTPSPEINPPRDIAPVCEWRIVPQTVNGIMPPVCFVPRADFEGLPKEWPADTAWKREASR